MDRRGRLPDFLQHVDVTYLNNKDCVDTSDYIEAEISDNMICAAKPGKDSCFGDSGGPLVDVENNVLVGVVSWAKGGCANPDFPGVYSNIVDQVST